MSDTVAIGLDVGGTGTKGALVTPAGEVLERTESRTDVTAGTKGIITVAEELLERAARQGSEVSGVGVAVAGFVDAARGAVTFSPNLVYDDPAVAAAVRARVDLPVVVENDANAAAWGEFKFGTARGVGHLAMLTLGTGVGAGFVVDGRLLRGATGAGAEFGHVIVESDGPLCNCGLRGCLEQFASGQAIERMAKEAIEEDPTSAILSFAGTGEQVRAEHVAQAARNYDGVATEVLRRAGRYLGIGLSNIVNVFDPQVIVLGGSVVGAGESYLGTARDTLNAMMNAQKRRPMRIDVTSLGKDAGIIGAASLAIQPVDSWEGTHHE
jgi:glucokinase